MMPREVLRISAFSLLTTLILGISVVFAQEVVSDEINSLNQSIEDKQQSIDQISRQIDSYQSLIDRKQAEEASLSAELDLLSNRTKKTELQIIQTEQEIDLVEESNGQITGFEFKWKSKKTKFPQNFIETYKAQGLVIDRNNFREFVKI